MCVSIGALNVFDHYFTTTEPSVVGVLENIEAVPNVKPLQWASLSFSLLFKSPQVKLLNWIYLFLCLSLFPCSLHSPLMSSCSIIIVAIWALFHSLAIRFKCQHYSTVTSCTHQTRVINSSPKHSTITSDKNWCWRGMSEWRPKWCIWFTNIQIRVYFSLLVQVRPWLFIHVSISNQNIFVRWIYMQSVQIGFNACHNSKYKPRCSLSLYLSLFCSNRPLFGW